tara:strand:+ start:12768 stop:13103 length:336 start_codon:yes stop_codon:yes gene_type:complete
MSNPFASLLGGPKWAVEDRDAVKEGDTILDTAKRVTAHDRGLDYGHPSINHKRTANFWSTYLGRDITPQDVCMMNILQKVSRGMNTLTEDTLVDIAGYARNIEMLSEISDG